MENTMLRISYMRKHPLYVSSYQRLQELEQERIFCCHQMNHLLDTARIAYILSLERGIGISKEAIYAAAILHDIEKGRQYMSQETHMNLQALILLKRYLPNCRKNLCLL